MRAAATPPPSNVMRFSSRPSVPAPAVAAAALQHIGPDGARLWTPGELAAVEKAFRGCSKHYVQDRR